MKIHCVGDSHANFFSGYDEPQPEWPGSGIRHRLPYFRCYRIGPVLAYNLNQLGTTSLGREKLLHLLSVLDKGSMILFCFGEIDCRAHIILQAQKQKRPVAAVVNEVVERYQQVILETEKKGFKPLLWNVVPSAPSDINERILVPPQYLFHGSCAERNQVTRLFNQALHDWSQRLHIPFLNIFEQLFDCKGQVNQDFYCDEIHLGQKAMPLVLQKLAEILPAIPEIERG